MKHFIYVLKDPITGVAHYLGYTSWKYTRLNKHLKNISGTKEKRIWIGNLKKQGLTPIMDPYCIGVKRAGMTGKTHSQITKDKMSASHRGKIQGPPSLEVRKRISDKMKGVAKSENARLKMSLALMGKPGHNKNMSWKLIGGKRIYSKPI